MNRIKVSILSDKDFESWNHYANNHPDSTFFHLCEWKNIISKSFNHKPYYLIANEGNCIKGIFPLFHMRSVFFGNFLVSTPFLVYGGICADSREIEMLLLEEGKKLARELGVEYLELRNCKPKGYSLPENNLYVAFQREIYDELDENMAAIPRKQRRMIRIGIGNGLSSRIGNEYLREFYEILATSYRNLGSPIFSYALFENIVQYFKDSCKILTVWKGNRMLSGVMTFFFRETVIPYYGGALREGFKYAVNDFMYWELMRYGCENRYRIFDFGRSKKGTGAYHFKKHWGFESEPLPYQYYMLKK
ncbi:MAG: FemAB family XrtA/PEP-CTERM system-associated protein, partial [Candidatus Thorarchaeota archaeon]